MKVETKLVSRYGQTGDPAVKNPRTCARLGAPWLCTSSLRPSVRVRAIELLVRRPFVPVISTHIAVQPLRRPQLRSLQGSLRGRQGPPTSRSRCRAMCDLGCAPQIFSGPDCCPGHEPKANASNFHRQWRACGRAFSPSGQKALDAPCLRHGAGMRSGLQPFLRR